MGLLAYIGADFKGIIYEFINQNDGDNSLLALYPVIATIGVFVAMCGYPFYVIIKLSKRPKRIDKLIEKASNGATLVNVFDHVEHKITIPVFKIKFKLLCPT